MSKRTQGAVSVFLIIVLVPMMTLTALFVDASRIALGRGVANSAGDLTMNTALTDYDTVLKDMYGLFATAQNTEELYASLEDYYRQCITSAGVSEEETEDLLIDIMAGLSDVEVDGDISDIMHMELVDFALNKREDATLANPTVLKKQIVEFMKYRAPINLGMSFLSALQSFTTLSQQTKLVDKRQDYYKAQKDLMESAKAAWDAINKYNQSTFIKEEDYFSKMEDRYADYPATYNAWAEKALESYIGTSDDHLSFSAKDYSFGTETVKVGNSQESVLVLYTNAQKTTKLSNYTEYSSFSSKSKAGRGDVKSALVQFNSAYTNMKNCRAALLDYKTNPHRVQYIVQTAQKDLYTNWISSVESCYNAYCYLKHVVKYADSSQSVMSTQDTLTWFTNMGQTSYQSYYNSAMAQFGSSFTSEFNSYLADLNSTVKSWITDFLKKDPTDTTKINDVISGIHKEVSGDYTSISEAKTQLEIAIQHLNDVRDKAKAGGAVDKARQEWESAAKQKDIKNTSMAKQDLAEVQSLSTFINAEDVQALIDRLTAIKGQLEGILPKIESYTFFDTKIIDIENYNNLEIVIVRNVDSEKRKNLPVECKALGEKVRSLIEGHFTYNSISTAWTKQAGMEPWLYQEGKQTLEFYKFLYTQFNVGPVSNSTKEKKEDKENGKGLYDKINSKSDDSASGAIPGKAKEEEHSGGDSNNICDQPELPSDKASNTSTFAGGSVSTGDEAVENTSSGLGAMFDALGDFLSDMATALRDKLYVSDYVLNMFSYDTVAKEYKEKHTKDGKSKEGGVPTMLTLEPITADNNFAYGSEVEYVIFGGSNSSCVTKAYGSIFGIRMGFNLIYAFTASDIRDTAFSIATPISAATLGVIPVPLIQATIIVGIALCESALDLSDLSNGKSVPLYKTAKTFRCSVKGMINTAKEKIVSVAEDAADYVIDAGAEKLTELLNMTDEELNKVIDGGTKSIEGYVGNAYDTMITTHANTAIQKLTTLANNAVQQALIDPATDGVQYVSDGLDEWLSNEAVGVDTNSDIGYLVKKEAVAVIKDGCIQTVLDAIKESKNSVESTIDAMGQKVNDAIEKVRSKIIGKIDQASGKIKDYKSELLGDFKDSIGKGASSLKETISSKLGGALGGNVKTGKEADTTGVSSLLSFYYSDYLRLFLLIGLCANEEGVLLRTADVIQVNMAKRTDNPEYRLIKSAQYVQLKADVQVKPTLLALPLFAKVEKNPKDNANWYSFTYENIRGY